MILCTDEQQLWRCLLLPWHWPGSPGKGRPWRAGLAGPGATRRTAWLGWSSWHQSPSAGGQTQHCLHRALGCKITVNNECILYIWITSVFYWIGNRHLTMPETRTAYKPKNFHLEVFISMTCHENVPCSPEGKPGWCNWNRKTHNSPSLTTSQNKQTDPSFLSPQDCCTKLKGLLLLFLDVLK